MSHTTDNIVSDSADPASKKPDHTTHQQEVSQHTRRMGSDPILKTMLHFAVPAMIGLLLHALYNFVDRFFVGNFVSVDALSAISVSFPLLIICFSFGMMISVGGAALISIQLGCKELKKAEQVLGNAFFLMLMISVCLSLIGLLFTEELLTTFGASQSIVGLSSQYLSIIFIGLPFDLLSLNANFYIRASGSPIYAMITLMIAAVANIILDAIMIVWLGWGIEGAALATILSQTLAAIWSVSYFFRKHAPLRLYLSKIVLKFSVCKQIISIGTSAFLMEVAFAILLWQMNRAIYPLAGDLGIAAIGIILTLSMLLYLPVFGVLEGARPLLGYNFGAKNYGRMLETLKITICGVSLLFGMGILIFFLIPDTLVEIFTEDDELIRLTVRGVRLAYWGTLFSGIAIVASCLFQSMAKPVPAAILSMCRNCFFVLLALMILPGRLGIDGIWLSFVAGDFLTFCLGIILLRIQWIKLKQLG